MNLKTTQFFKNISINIGTICQITYMNRFLLTKVKNPINKMLTKQHKSIQIVPIQIQQNQTNQGYSKPKDINQQILTYKQLKKYDLKDPSQLHNMNIKQKVNVIVNEIWKVSDSISPKDIKSEMTTEQLTQFQQNRHLKIIQLFKKLSLKEFSVVVHHVLVEGPKFSSIYNKLLWKQIQNVFVSSLQPTTNPSDIRSYSKIFYALTKSKTHRNNPSTTITTTTSIPMQNFETKFSIMLPFASHQSFTAITTGFSRMGPISEQFAYIIQSLYYKRKQELSSREKIQIMYVLTRNNRNMDSKIVEQIDNMNVKEIILMLRCFNNCDKLFNSNELYKGKNLLQFSQKHILARKQQINVIDLGQLCQIYFEGTINKDYKYKMSKSMEDMLANSYETLKNNINQVAFMKIWKYLPKIVNCGYLKINFVQTVLSTMKILRKKNMFPERIWKTIRLSAEQFQNLQIRLKIQKIQ